MRSISLLLLAVTFLIAQRASAQPFTLDKGYLRKDGAIVTLYKANDIIDPYFPTKALLLAHDHGMDITELGLRWVNWMLVHQQENGLFARYCIDEKQQVYRACAVADADDSMMIMWMELLYRLAPKEGLPEKWALSFYKAEAQLDRIYDSKRNIYLISKAMPVGLLMDNVEIYAGFKRIETEARRLGSEEVAAYFAAKADHLKGGIIKTFWRHGPKRYIASTQTERKDFAFYPDKVVQVTPMTYNLEIRQIRNHKKFYHQWMHAHRAEWFAMIGKDFPWGLLAVLAANQNDIKTSYCWYKKAKPERHGVFWNVMDEAAFQVVERKVLSDKAANTIKCEGSYS